MGTVSFNLKSLSYLYGHDEKKILCISAGGSGDIILGCQVTHHIQKKVGPGNVELLCLARNETFKPIELLFGDQMIIKQHELKERWGENYQLITNPDLLKQIKKDYSEVYIVIPDLLFRAREYSFDFNKYNCSPQTVIQTRLLTHKSKLEKIVYCAFANTTTKGYNYTETKKLVELLAYLLPDYKFYVPVLSKWNNEEIIGADKNVELNNLSGNVLIDFDPTWERAISFMSCSKFIIALDSAPFHLAYQFGIERVCLDPHFGYLNNQHIWGARWRNTGMNDSIAINSPPEMIAQLVVTNIMIPQTTLLPKWFVYNNLEKDWVSYLGFKF